MDYGSNRATSERLGRMSRARPGRTGCSLRRRSAGARLGQAASVLAMRQPERRFRAHRYAEMSARMTFLTRTDPTRNINRFYIVECHADAVRRMGGRPRMGPARLARHRAAQQLPTTR